LIILFATNLSTFEKHFIIAAETTRPGCNGVTKTPPCRGGVPPWRLFLAGDDEKVVVSYLVWPEATSAILDCLVLGLVMDLL